MHAITDPRSRGGDPLTSSYCGRMTHHSHKIALPPRLHLEHAKTILDVVEGDALNRACQRLNRRAALDLSRSDHQVHALVQGATAAPAPLTLDTQSLARDAWLASVHGHSVLSLFYGIGPSALQGPHTRPNVAEGTAKLSEVRSLASALLGTRPWPSPGSGVGRPIRIRQASLNWQVLSKARTAALALVRRSRCMIRNKRYWTSKPRSRRWPTSPNDAGRSPWSV